MRKITVILFVVAMIISLSLRNELTAQEKVDIKQASALRTAANASFDLDGYFRKRIDKSIYRYFLETPESSPAILQVLRDRDRLPIRKPLVPWAGEFAGKYLTGAELVWRVTHNAELKKAIDSFVRNLISCQDRDGYLGPFSKNSRLTGKNRDVWGHYHCMLGLMFYYEDTRYEPALEACEKAAHLPGGTVFTPGSYLYAGGISLIPYLISDKCIIHYHKVTWNAYPVSRLG